MVFDNGQNSLFQNPPGDERAFASPRKYSLDLVAKVATEVWNFPMNESIRSPFCGSSYEDAPYNYLVDYAIVNGGIPERSHVRSTPRPGRRWRRDFLLSIPDHGL